MLGRTPHPIPPSLPPSFHSEKQETEDYIIYPREAPGLDYKLNWSLNADDVTPAGNAYRNLDAAQLKGKRGGKEGGKEVKLLEAGDTVPFETFDAHLADVKATLVRIRMGREGGREGRKLNVIARWSSVLFSYLSSPLPPFLPPPLPPSPTQEKATDLYVEDGSSKGAAFNVRVISDSPAYALAAKAVLDQAQTNSSSWPFAKNVIVYAAGGAKAFAGVMFAGGKAGEVTGKEGRRGGREGGEGGSSSSWPFARSVIVCAVRGAKAFFGVMFAGGKVEEVTGKKRGEGMRDW